MKTFLEICQNIGLKTNSELDDSISTLSDVEDEQINAVNDALMLIWNYEDNWQLRHAKTTFDTVADQSDYSMVEGYIKENGVKIEDVTTPLYYESNYESLSTSSGTPDRYWIEGDNIVLYPTPDDVKTVTVKYKAECPVLTTESVEQDFFENSDDVLNIPSRFEKYFISALAHLTNKILNGDPTDEEYLEHDTKFIQFIKIIRKADTGTADNSASFVI